MINSENRETEETIKARLYKEFEEIEKKRLGVYEFKKQLIYKFEEFVSQQWDYVGRRFTEEKYKQNDGK